jgi:transglutaminase-like putative cysteine protease
VSDREKWAFLQQAPARDALDPRVRALAARLSEAADLPGGSWPERCRRFAMLAHTVARDWIRYQSDTDRTGGEDIAGFTRPPAPGDAFEALGRGLDDCDAKARIFPALCLAAGIPAEMVPRWEGEKLAHVSARVWITGGWPPVETILARARLGETAESVPFEKGKNEWLRS